MPVTQSQSVMPEGLIKALRRDAVSMFGLPAVPTIVLRKTIRNPYSQVHVADITQNQFHRRVYVKIPHSEIHGMTLLKERLISEYEIMQKLRDHDSNRKGYGVAIPFGFYPEYPAYATLEAARDTLRMHYHARARVLVPSFLRSSVMEEVSNCGKWLREFQENTLKGPAPFDVRELATYSDVRLQRLLRQNQIEFSSGLAEGVLQAIHDLGSRIDPGENRISGRHNDFASHNILAEAGRVWVIDFSMFDYGSSAYDSCNFWFDLEMLKLDPTYSGQFLSDLQARFLVSYGLMTPESPAFNLARCRYTLNRLVTSLDGSKGWQPGSLYRRNVVRVSLKWLQSLATGLQFR